MKKLFKSIYYRLLNSETFRYAFLIPGNGRKWEWYIVNGKKYWREVPQDKPKVKLHHSINRDGSITNYTDIPMTC
jgi:hypothetical protein